MQHATNVLRFAKASRVISETSFSICNYQFLREKALKSRLDATNIQSLAYLFPIQYHIVWTMHSDEQE